MAGKRKEKNVTEDPRYHDTRRLLRKYRKMIKLLDNAVELLRTRHKNGEAYYWLLYYGYLSPQQYQNTEEIIEQLRPHIRDISRATYFRKQEGVIITGHESQTAVHSGSDTQVTQSGGPTPAPGYGPASTPGGTSVSASGGSSQVSNSSSASQNVYSESGGGRITGTEYKPGVNANMKL